MNEKYHEASNELIRTIKKFVCESNERMLENEKVIEKLGNQLFILTKLTLAMTEEE
jgi:hypothetical protein